MPIKPYVRNPAASELLGSMDAAGFDNRICGRVILPRILFFHHGKQCRIGNTGGVQ